MAEQEFEDIVEGGAPDPRLKTVTIMLRDERDRRLRETDHWAYQDMPEMSDEQRTYRQRLRDITEHFWSINHVEWPELGQQVWPSVQTQTQTGGAQSPEFTGGEVVQEDNPLFTPGT